MTESYLSKADEEPRSIDEEPKGLEEFISQAKENPVSVSHSSKYLLEAIEHYGKRDVIESGEEKERWRFFDDPNGDGEHAVLGHTEVLNEFVDELRRMVSQRGEDDKIFWFEGPTATGKSELKRCLISGVRGFAKTERGKKYTVEWTLDSLKVENNRMSYGQNRNTHKDWYRSPVNVNPLSVLPEETRKNVVEEINNRVSDNEITVESDIDPFSREAFENLQQKYSDEDNFYSKINEDHLRIIRYIPRVGSGIGVLHSEDSGSVKEKLVGSWMPSMMKEFASRGKKNPQAFTYDGVLSQGNGLISIVEDAGQHSDVLQNLLNIPEEGMVKLDNKISMDIDTVMIVISNPDLEAELFQFAEKGHHDPLKALRRRLDMHEFGYLTSFSLETQLIRRLLTGEKDVWTEDPEDIDDRVDEAVYLYDCEFSPHSIESAAMYEILSRIENPRGNFTSVDKALIYDRGYHIRDNKKIPIEDIEEDIKSENDGEKGMPVTYTIDILVDLAQEEKVVMPWDVIEAMVQNMRDEPLFSKKEIEGFAKKSTEVQEYVLDKIEEDVLEGILQDEMPSKESINEYIDSLFAWNEAKSDISSEDDDFDEYELREFETKYLGISDGGYTQDAIPKKDVKDFRKDDIVAPLKSEIWNSKGDDFTLNEEDLTQAEPFEVLLGEYNWDLAETLYPNINYYNWSNPPNNTETEEVKKKAVENMVEDMGYSEESAERASVRVVEARAKIETMKTIAGE